jgi:hypothetical protein
LRQLRLKKTDLGMNMLGAGLTALGLFTLSTLPASCGGGGDTGPGSGGGASGTTVTTSVGPGGTSTSSGPATCAGGCGVGEVCAEGACVAVPDHCPCPQETYCDLNTNACKIGCLSDPDCSSGHYCDVPNRACVVGCRESAECSGGTKCIDHQCKAGCNGDGDCANSGETCVSNACSCGAGQVVCGSACTPLGTNTNCSSCADSCQGAAMCVGGSCQCELGKCGAAAVADLAGVMVGSYDVDDQSVYYSKGATEIYRTPVAGGAPSLIASDVMAIEDVRIAGSNVVYTWFDNTGASQYKLKKVPAQGGQITTLDSSTNPVEGAISYHLAVRSIGSDWAAYWWARTKMNEVSVATGAPITTFLPGNYNPEGPMVTDDLYLYSATYSFNAYTFTRDGTLLDGYGTSSFESYDLAVDNSNNFYFTDNSTGSILLIKSNSHSAVYSGLGKLNALAVDDTNLYWITASGKDYEVLRGPKAGGSPTSLYKGKGVYVYSARELKLHGGFVYWIADDKIWRVAQ